MSRKKELSQRSFAYAQLRADSENSTIVNLRAYAFQDGYRTAMRDMRKAVKFIPDDYSPGMTVEDRRIRFCCRVQRFLRPLR